MLALRPPLLALLGAAFVQTDPLLAAHTHRVTRSCTAILRALGVDPLTAARMLVAARLHDLGKLSLPASLLVKKGALTSAERTLMETHPERGAAWIGRLPACGYEARIVRHHHERWDSQGYPSRLAGNAIPLGARVIAVADTWDAITHDRPYRAAGTPAAARAVLEAGAGTQWDPSVVEVWLRYAHEAGLGRTLSTGKSPTVWTWPTGGTSPLRLPMLAGPAPGGIMAAA